MDTDILALNDKTTNITRSGVNTDIINGFARYQGFVYDTPTAINHLTPKVYVDTKLAKTGGTMTGVLTQNNTTQSTTPITGSIQTNGGLGVVGNIYNGDGIFSDGDVSGTKLVCQNATNADVDIDTATTRFKLSTVEATKTFTLSGAAKGNILEYDQNSDVIEFIKPTKFTAGIIDSNDDPSYILKKGSGTNSYYMGDSVFTGSGNDNLSMGSNISNATATGFNNVLVGGNVSTALNASNSVIIGQDAGSVNASSTCVLIGSACGELIVSGGQTCLGYKAGRNATGGVMTAIGNEAGQNAGQYSTAVGHGCLRNGVNVGQATAIGHGTLVSTTGADNTALGAFAGDAITSGRFNCFLGSRTDGAATLDNQIAIGYQVETTAANQCVIGNDSVAQVLSDGFRDLDTVSPVDLLIGKTNATKVVIGKNGSVNTTIRGFTHLSNNNAGVAGSIKFYPNTPPGYSKIYGGITTSGVTGIERPWVIWDAHNGGGGVSDFGIIRYFTNAGESFRCETSRIVVANDLVIDGTTPSTLPTNGSITTAGGLGVAGDVNCGGDIDLSVGIKIGDESSNYNGIKSSGKVNNSLPNPNLFADELQMMRWSSGDGTASVQNNNIFELYSSVMLGEQANNRVIDNSVVLEVKSTAIFNDTEKSTVFKFSGNLDCQEAVICRKNVSIIEDLLVDGDIGRVAQKVPNIHCDNIFYTQANPSLRNGPVENVNISDTFLLLNDRIEKVVGSFVNFGGDETNIFNDRSYFNLNGESTSQTSSSINYDNTFLCPCDCKIESISFIKRNEPLSSVQIVINQVVNELHVFDLLGRGNVINTDILLSRGDIINLCFRNTNGTPNFSRYTLYLVRDNNTPSTSTSNPITLNFDESDLLPPSKSLEDRIEELENRLNELVS